MFRTSLLAAVFTVGCLSAASAAMIDFHATLDGKSEVPPNASTGSGDVLATLDTSSKKLTYTMTYMGLSGPATAAHFHGPAAVGANAGVAVPIGTNPHQPDHRHRDADRCADQGPGSRPVVCECPHGGQSRWRNPRPDDAHRFTAFSDDAP